MSLSHPDAGPDAPPPTPGVRLDRARLRLRRTVLRRRRSLAAALTCVAVAAGLSATVSPDVATEPVLVAARDLPPGAVLTREDLVVVRFLPGTAPMGALRDEASLVGRLLAGAVGTGEPVTGVRLVGPDLVAAEPGRQAVPVRLPDPGMVALLEVGDRVDLLAAAAEDGRVTTVATGVPVLALPTGDAGGSATASGLPGGLVVVGLTAAEVAPVTAAALRSFVTYTWASR